MGGNLCNDLLWEQLGQAMLVAQGAVPLETGAAIQAQAEDAGIVSQWWGEVG